MATTIIAVRAGATSDPQPVGPNTSIFAGPSVLGGTITLETAPTNAGPWLALTTTNGGGYSARLPYNGWVRLTAATQAANLVLADIGGANQAGSNLLVTSNVVFATPSSTAEQIVFGVRFPPNFLPPNFRCDIRGSLTVTNNANVKTLNVKVNGTGGTAVFTSPSLASNANYNFAAAFCGTNALTLKGVGAGATGGWGLSTTAYSSLAYDFIGRELEVVVTGTKATGTDTFQLDSLNMTLS